MDSRAQRLARNEDRFRDANERLRRVLSEGGSANGGRVAFLCECADRDCAEDVRLTMAEYRLVRGDPTWFVVVPGHELSDIEDVVKRGDGYLVVAKRGAAGEASRQLDS